MAASDLSEASVTDDVKRPLTPSDFLYEGETEQHLGVYSAIGRVVVLWGMLEFHFGGDVMQIFQKYSWPGKPRKPPGQMESKLQFWDDAFASVPELTHLSEKATEWSARMKSAANDRNALMHYNWSQILEGDFAGGADGSSIKARKEGHELWSAKISLQQLYLFTEEIDILNGALLQFSLMIAQTEARRG